jgi:hypothetical protein
LILDQLKAKVLDAHMLTNGKELKFKQKNDQLQITLPKKQIDPFNTVIKLKLSKAIIEMK